jgi:hypothetical protein
MKKWRQDAGTPDAKYSVREALAAGHNLAFVGGSDDHSGQPGSKALTAVWARELTREAILGAIRGRHCYATTGNRTVVFGFDLSGRMCFVVAPSSPIERVECFVGGKPVDIEPEISDPWSALLYLEEPNPPLDETTWYVRVIHADGGAAWSTLATPPPD